jgi:kynurenine formamidase
MSQTALSQLISDLAGGHIRIVDLTQTLSPDFPQIVLPPEMGQAWPFRIEEASRYDARGPGWYWNNFSCSEHTGTHFDAPIHWISGRHLPDNSTDTIPVKSFVAPACVIDCSKESTADADFLLTVDFLRKWERNHGRIPPGSWILMRTDWSKRTDPVAYQNLDETGQHTPGPDTAAVQFLPPVGAVIIAAPLKIKEGSGSPLRVLALVPQSRSVPARTVKRTSVSKKARAKKKRR